MADQENSVDYDVKVLKKTRISVLVDEALPDILVVTYEYGLKIFKGVLLDSTKRNLPFGIHALNPAFTSPKKLKPEDDPLYAVNQRFTYTDPNTAKKKNVQLSNKYKQKMTVRLRPRQVLCSKCKGVCSENSDTVSTRKRKLSETISSHNSSPVKALKPRGINAPITRSVYSTKNLRSRGPSLVPKLTRLSPEEERIALSGQATYSKAGLTKKPLSTQNVVKNESNEVSPSENDCKVAKSGKKQAKRQKSVDVATVEPCEDVKEDPVNINPELCTRTIKISYGPQGEGTVLKIPAKLDPILASDDSEENINVDDTLSKDKDTKAVRKALKKAKKEAKRKISGSSPPSCFMGVLGGGSPRYGVGSSSPRYTVGSASPRQGLGSNSPRYMCSNFDINVPRRRKHKMKHKKRHREEKDRKHKEGEVSSSTQDDGKEEQCCTQKLSINLRRLNEQYASYNPATKNEENTSSSDEQSEQVPDFPPPNPPLMLRINSQTVSCACGAGGSRLLVGDVVWGKIHGFPWWPGKILTITNCNNKDPQAHVSWYGSSTSSLMPCDQLCPYLDNFKIRYNKKKRGPYKEAIKQATTEARENAEAFLRHPLGNSPSHNIIAQVVPPALASPREIDVVS